MGDRAKASAEVEEGRHQTRQLEGEDGVAAATIRQNAVLSHLLDAVADEARHLHHLDAAIMVLEPHRGAVGREISNQDPQPFRVCCTRNDLC